MSLFLKRNQEALSILTYSLNESGSYFLPLQCESNDIRKACLTRDSSSLDCIYKMYFENFLIDNDI